MKLKQIVPYLMLSLMLLTPIAFADSSFDDILKPVVKVYDFAKYAASIIAMIFLLFAGITYMTSGGDTQKREQAKNMVMYVVIGLVVIWAAPLIVNFVVG